MQPRCIACAAPISPASCFDGWCIDCAGKVLSAVLALRDVRDRAMLVAYLQDVGADAIAGVIVGHD